MYKRRSAANGKVIYLNNAEIKSAIIAKVFFLWIKKYTESKIQKMSTISLCALPAVSKIKIGLNKNK